MARRRYQAGTLRLEGKVRKMWTLRWREDQVQADGSIRRVGRKSVIGSHSEFPTQRLARRRADLLLSKLNRPDYRPGKVINFSGFAERWKEHIISQWKPSTQRGVISHLNCYVLPYFATATLDHIGQEDVQRFVSTLKDKRRGTIRNVLAVLFSILNTARKWGYTVSEIRQGDIVISSTRPRRTPYFFTAEQTRSILLEAAEPWRTIFAVAAFTGMRAGEILGLGIDDLDFEKKEISIRRSAWMTQLVTPKTERSAGRVPMPHALEEILLAYITKQWKPNEKQLLFFTQRGNPINRTHLVELRLYPILDKLNIPRCGMHAFRHGVASLMISSGASLKVTQEQLRHADPMTTVRMYVHSIGDEQRAAVEKMSDILRPNATELAANTNIIN